MNTHPVVFLPESLTSAEERRLLDVVRTIEFRDLLMHGVRAKRRIEQFGLHYAFETYRLMPTDPIPSAFETIQARSAALAGIDPCGWAEVLVTEYHAGAGIGWHRDAPAFGIIAGVSLLGSCRMRFQTNAGPTRVTRAIELPPRSVYLLTGEVRAKWQHMIPSTRELRYSITFRTLKKPRKGDVGQAST